MQKTMVKINREDWTASGEGRDELFFLTHKFKDGSFLGFWSHSPWGRVHDMEKGWLVISNKGEILSEKETRSMGMSVGNWPESWREWRTTQKRIHGPSTRLLDDFDEPAWVMTRDT